MARLGIDFDDVARAAERIIVKGENPTIEKIRIALGSRGSYSTISKYLAKWRANSLPEKLLKNNDDAPEPVARTISVVWEHMQQEKAAEIEEFKTRLESENRALQDKNNELEKNLADMTLKNQELNQSLADVRQELSKTGQLLEQAKIESGSLKVSNRESKRLQEQMLAKLEQRHKAEQQRLYTDLDKSKKAYESYRQQATLTIDKLKADQAKLEASLDVATKAKSELETKISDDRASLADLLDKSVLGLGAVNTKLDKVLAEKKL